MSGLNHLFAFMPWSEFPTLHPLVVHFPVVLLPLGTLLLVAGWAARARALEWTAAVVLAAAFVTGLLASRVFHPHPEMTLLAMEVFEAHEFWADWTVGLSALATVFAFLLAWGAPRFRISLAVLALLAAMAATLAVMATGHHGATLTHIHRVGGE